MFPRAMALLSLLLVVVASHACGFCCCRACWGLLLPSMSLPPPLAFPIATNRAAAIYA